MSKYTEEYFEAKKFNTETQLQAYCLRRIEELSIDQDIVVFKVIRANKNGVSDIILMVAGQFVAIEMKQPYGKVSPLQQKFIIDVNKRGGIAGVAYNWGDVKVILRKAGVIV